MNPKYQKAVEVHRMTIARLLSEIGEVEHEPASKHDVSAKTRGWLENVAADRERSMRYALANFADGADPSPFIVRPGPNGAVDLAPLLLAVLGVEVIHAGLSKYIEALPEGLSDADREKQLQKLRAALLEAEHLEQDAIDGASAEGVHIAYRADADPAVVLRVRP